MRKLFAFLLCCVCLQITPVFADVPTAAPIASVEYVHNAIEQQLNITVPYNPNLTNRGAAANMEYLLTAIDVANALAGRTTSYGTGEYATKYAANTAVVIQAIETLGPGAELSSELYFTTIPDTTSFSFIVTAAGEFQVDWGDDAGIETVTNEKTAKKTISHTYTTPGEYKIHLAGSIIGYNNNANNSISLKNNTALARVDGSFASVFPIIGTDVPTFYETFYGCTNLAYIPENLFYGLETAPVKSMFNSTFTNCTSLTEIPPKLFAQINGAPATSVFYGTFKGCTGITEIPHDLFAGIVGKPAQSMFAQTFVDCHGITEIPSDLFAGISGAPAAHMYNATFQRCTNITEIPVGLFGDISGDMAASMFAATFDDCTKLAGPSARNPDGEYLYNQFPDATTTQVKIMYRGATGLSDYDDIPTAWK